MLLGEARSPKLLRVNFFFLLALFLHVSECMETNAQSAKRPEQDEKQSCFKSMVIMLKKKKKSSSNSVNLP